MKIQNVTEKISDEFETAALLINSHVFNNEHTQYKIATHAFQTHMLKEMM